MDTIKENIEIKKGSEKNFGIVFGLVFLIISFYPLLLDSSIRLWSLCISIIFIFLAFFIPKLLKYPNHLWFLFGILLGKIVSPFIMGIVFYTTITPTGLIMRLLGKDILKKKFEKKIDSYWVDRKNITSSMRNQF